MAWPPKKNTAVTFEFPIRDADGDLVTTGTLSSTLIQDGTAKVGPVPTVVASGGGSLTVTIAQADNNFDRMTFIGASDLAGAKPYFISWDTVLNQIDDLATPTNITAGVIETVTDVTNLHASAATLANQTTILDRLGAFTGSGINNILGFFQSLLRSDIATDPTDIGGTFDSTTDSAQSIRDHGDTDWITATGFASATDYTTARAAKLDEITAARLGELDAANLPADVAAILVDSGELQTDWIDGGRLDLLLDRLITQIDTAVGEPGQGALPVSGKMALKIDYLYKFLRNKKDQTSTLFQAYNDAGTVVDQKATVSESAGTTTTEEIVSGP